MKNYPQVPSISKTLHFSIKTPRNSSGSIVISSSTHLSDQRSFIQDSLSTLSSSSFQDRLLSCVLLFLRHIRPAVSNSRTAMMVWRRTPGALLCRRDIRVDFRSASGNRILVFLSHLHDILVVHLSFSYSQRFSLQLAYTTSTVRPR